MELPTIKSLIADGAIVACVGGGGVPVSRDEHGRLRGVEAVVDKDLGSAFLAECIGADALMLLTDVPAVEIGFGADHAHPIGRTTVGALQAQSFAAGSMGPKVEGACRFVEHTGQTAMIGLLDRAPKLLAQKEGTIIDAAPAP